MKRVLYLTLILNFGCLDCVSIGPNVPEEKVRIIGGSAAGLGEIPYQVTLQAFNFVGGVYLLCGGSIISPWHVLTAGNCVAGQNIRNMEIVAGTNTINVPTLPSEQRRNVDFVTVHPNFDGYTLDADIAVITLTRPFIFNEYVKSIALAPAGLEPSGSCLNSGFGNILNNGSSHFPSTLQKVELQILPRELCREKYPSSGPITLGMVCASVPEGGKGACHGDSGGPLVCQMESNEARISKSYLAGSVSWGMKICALPNQPSVYSNVGHYREFIDEVISD